jgi:hypothetical protein
MQKRWQLGQGRLPGCDGEFRCKPIVGPLYLIQILEEKHHGG